MLRDTRRITDVSPGTGDNARNGIKSNTRLDRSVNKSTKSNRSTRANLYEKFSDCSLRRRPSKPWLTRVNQGLDGLRRRLQSENFSYRFALVLRFDFVLLFTLLSNLVFDFIPFLALSPVPGLTSVILLVSRSKTLPLYSNTVPLLKFLFATSVEACISA